MPRWPAWRLAQASFAKCLQARSFCPRQANVTTALALAISGLTRNSPKLDGHRSGLTSWGLGSKVLRMVDKTGDSVSLVIGEIESEIFRVLSIQPRI